MFNLSNLSTLRGAAARLARRMPRSSGSGQFRFKSTHTAQGPWSSFNPSAPWSKKSILMGWRIVGLGGTGLVLNSFFNAAPDHLLTYPGFFETRFVTKSNNCANDLADFYGTEDFMQIFCVFPFVEQMMMRGSYFDDEGVVHTWGFPIGSMLVSMEFDDREEEVTGPDGQPETVVAHFNKMEKFENVVYNPLSGQQITLWHMVTHFGYNRLEDGTCEVYHKGQEFYGPFPIRWIFWAHAKYVAWATEQHINSMAFLDSDKIEEQEAQRRNIPMHVFNGFLDQLASDVEGRIVTMKALGQRTTEAEKTLAKLRTHQSGFALNRQQSVASGLPEEVVAAVEFNKARVRRMQSRMSSTDGQRVESTVSLVVGDPEVQQTIKTALSLSQEAGGQSNNALEQLLGGAGDKWVEGAPIGSSDRELARKIAQRNAVVYDVAKADPQLAQKPGFWLQAWRAVWPPGQGADGQKQ